MVPLNVKELQPGEYLILTPDGWRIGEFGKHAESPYGEMCFVVHGHRVLPDELVAEVYAIPGDAREVKFKAEQTKDATTITGLTDGEWYLIKGSPGWRVAKWGFDKGVWAFRDVDTIIYDVTFAWKAYKIDKPKKFAPVIKPAEVKMVAVKLLKDFMNYRAGLEVTFPETQANSLIGKGLAEAVKDDKPEAKPEEPAAEKTVDAPPANKAVQKPPKKK